MKPLRSSFYLFVFILFANSVNAQNTAQTDFLEKQFYGNRVKLGSVMINGSMGYDNNLHTRDRQTRSFGIGIGVGLSEHLMAVGNYGRFNDEYTRVNASENSSNVEVTSNSYNAGLRFLFPTMGGFIQPYIGLEGIFAASKTIDESNEANKNERGYAGAQMPIGLTVWISTFMAIHLEPFNMSLISQSTDGVYKDFTLNAGLTMVNPKFGFSFILNSLKP